MGEKTGGGACAVPAAVVGEVRDGGRRPVGRTCPRGAGLEKTPGELTSNGTPAQTATA